MTRAWLAIIALLLIALGLSRLQYAGLERDMARERAEHALELKQISDAALAAQMSATQARARQEREIAALDAKRYRELTDANREIDRLMADVAAGRKRLLVAAKCPAGADHMPRASTSTSVDDGARAELDPAARSTHHALRRGLPRVEAKLAACQNYVLAVRR